MNAVTDARPETVRITDWSAELTNVNLRVERHGDERELAVDLKFRANRENAVLGMFDSALLDALYDDGTPPGTDAATKAFAGMENKAHLRLRKLAGPLKLSTKLVGARVSIPYGVSDEIVAHSANVDKWSVEPKDGGSVVLSWRVQMPASEDDVAKLASMLQAGEVTLSIEGAQAELFDGDDE